MLNPMTTKSASVRVLKIVDTHGLTQALFLPLALAQERNIA